MLWRVNFYSICFAFGLSVLLILVGNRYADNTYYRPSLESRRNSGNFLKVKVGEERILQPLPTNSYDVSPEIENILEKTRAKIKFELSDYNLSQSGVRVLEDFITESGGQPLQSIIISTWRSGTTFLADVLSAIPGTYYHYEPLMKNGDIQIRGPPETDKVISFIKNLLKCKHEDIEDYFQYGKTHLYQFSHNTSSVAQRPPLNTRLWEHCKYKKELCFDADFTSRICKLFPFQSMKVVRLRLQDIQEILDDKELNVKVVFLIRDPRGVRQSRLGREFCRHAPDCIQPSVLCADMISDYMAASRLLQHYPDRLMVLRYEELALEPRITTHRILKFLRLTATETLEEFLHIHTNLEKGGVGSPNRFSSDVPFKWRNVLDFNYVDEIQMACKEAMTLWGYRMAHNATHMASKEFDPVGDYTISQ